MKYIIPALFLLLFLVPVVLRKPAEKLDKQADQLVIISPHNEAVRYEIEQAFRKFYREKTGREVCLDWRAIGGGSEISRYINSAFSANFRNYWCDELKQDWSQEIATDFLNPKITGQSPAWAARRAFLNSEVGIDIDLFFGGGQYDANKYAQAGILVPCGVRQRHPEWFAGDKPILNDGGGGEIWNDSEDRYYATCFSTFGICTNRDRLKLLGFGPGQPRQLTTWRDLGDPVFFQALGLADPSQSGSICKCFEMIVQRQMQDTRLALEEQVKSGALTEEAAMDQAWREAMTLLKQIGANARYLTSSASKVPVDAASGQIAAGMCIDFYGRSQAGWEASHVGRATMDFLAPEAGTTVSGDPVALFRGAPHGERAKMFIDFLLSQEGQKLWNFRLGTPGGPVKYEIHRLPVRRDLYTDELRPYMDAPEADPFRQASSFNYRKDWTGALFDLLRLLEKVMLIDCHEELQQAWQALISRSERPEAAWQEFIALPFEFSQAKDIAAELRKPNARERLSREWLLFFRERFLKTAEKCD